MYAAQLPAWLVFLLVCLAADTANAYIGPGAGLTAIGSFLALLAALVVGAVGFLWYPIKRLRNRWKRRKADDGKT
jgi:hypothetical protein